MRAVVAGALALVLGVSVAGCRSGDESEPAPDPFLEFVASPDLIGRTDDDPDVIARAGAPVIWRGSTCPTLRRLDRAEMVLGGDVTPGRWSLLRVETPTGYREVFFHTTLWVDSATMQAVYDDIGTGFEQPCLNPAGDPEFEPVEIDGLPDGTSAIEVFYGPSLMAVIPDIEHARQLIVIWDEWAGDDDDDVVHTDATVDDFPVDEFVATVNRAYDQTIGADTPDAD